jgi:hypothetical protein
MAVGRIVVTLRHHIPARREFKYLFPRTRMPELRAALQPWCDLDPYAGPDRRYTVRSLYFDAPDMRLFKANEREAPVRFKARIRCYPASTPWAVFAEIKYREGDVIRKTRDPLPKGDWAAGLRAGGGAALGPFVTRMHQNDLRPVVLVEYRREAWVSRVDEYARVSIDTSLRCQPADRLELEANPRRWRAIDNPLRTFTPESPCVVELKWAETAPSWMFQLTQRLDLLRHSYSKYCYSILALADDQFCDYREAQSIWG